MRKNNMPSIPSKDAIKWKNYTCQIQAGGWQMKAQDFAVSAPGLFEA